MIFSLERVQGELGRMGNGAFVSWEHFSSDFLPGLSEYLPTALDRMELHKNLINQLEFKHNFTLENLE